MFQQPSYGGESRTHKQRSQSPFAIPIRIPRSSIAENIITNSFKITIKDIDPNFEYIRIYSIHRTSIDATPEVKKVIDISTDVVKSNITSEVTNTYTRIGLNTPVSVSFDGINYADLRT